MNTYIHNNECKQYYNNWSVDVHFNMKEIGQRGIIQSTLSETYDCLKLK